MKALFNTLLLFFLTRILFSQNLVPNPSFETFSSCPSNYGQVTNATGWQRSTNNNNPTYHTEYCNTCATSGLFQVPSNTHGTQTPATGNAYMAMAMMAPTIATSYRENIYIQLLSPLVIGTTYQISLKVSHADESQNATNKIGAKLSTVPTFPINNVSQVYSTAVITDQTNWTTISGQYIADSSYQYIAVGNFFTDANTTQQKSSPNSQWDLHVYYIDDVSVIPLCSAPIPTITGDTIICSGETSILTASGGESYSWNTGSTDSIYNVSPSTTTTYTLTTSIGSCSATKTITIHVNSIPNATISGNTTICENTNETLSAPSGLSYQWSTGQTTQSIQINSPGTYWLTVSQNQCANSDTITINQTIVNVNLGSDTSVCTTQFIITATGNGTTHLWSTGETSQSIQITSSGIYWVDMSTLGCTKRDSIDVQLGTLSIDLGSDINVCSPSTNLSVSTNGTNYFWSTGETTNSINVSQSGSYWINVNQGTCSGTDTINVNLSAPLNIDLGNDTSVCNSVNFVLNAGVSGSDYLWSTGETTSSITINNSGEYWVVVNNGACTGTDTLFINTSDPTIQFETTGNLCEFSEMTIDIGNSADFYIWSTGDTTSYIQINDSGTYWVNAYKGSCLASDTIEINESLGSGTIYFPNAFTPNGDEKNDVFLPSINGITYLKLDIYDRWGNLIYETNELYKGWDGSTNGRKVPLGVYVWVAEYQSTCTLEKMHTIIGHVSLLR